MDNPETLATLVVYITENDDKQPRMDNPETLATLVVYITENDDKQTKTQHRKLKHGPLQKIDGDPMCSRSRRPLITVILHTICFDKKKHQVKYLKRIVCFCYLVIKINFLSIS
jgi:hypothetical protein